MSKVIRIEDELFRRLQRLAEPFIDTPSTVIERLINFYESSHGNITGKEQGTEIMGKAANKAGNLFLAPASLPNIKKTITGSVKLQSFRKLLTEKEKRLVTDSLTDLENIHCWAMTESSRAEFNEMVVGDIVLFTIKDSGKFEYCGKVVLKIENELVGRFLWDEEAKSNKPWELIYFLDDIQRINISKPDLVCAVGYKRNYWVPGITRVNRVARDTILSQHGSIEAFVQTLST